MEFVLLTCRQLIACVTWWPDNCRGFIHCASLPLGFNTLQRFGSKTAREFELFYIQKRSVTLSGCFSILIVRTKALKHSPLLKSVSAEFSGISSIFDSAPGAVIWIQSQI